MGPHLSGDSLRGTLQSAKYLWGIFFLVKFSPLIRTLNEWATWLLHYNSLLYKQFFRTAKILHRFLKNNNQSLYTYLSWGCFYVGEGTYSELQAKEVPQNVFQRTVIVPRSFQFPLFWLQTEQREQVLVSTSLKLWKG